MRILVDGDGCPSKDSIVEMTKKYQLEMLVFIDYAHMLDSEDYQTIMCEVGADSVDMKIVNMVKKGDLVITQDYGLASLVLGRQAYVLHVSGKVIDQNNIDQLLLSRYTAAKIRKAGGRTKGPAKRSQADELFFKKQLEEMILDKAIRNL